MRDLSVTGPELRRSRKHGIYSAGFILKLIAAVAGRKNETVGSQNDMLPSAEAVPQMVITAANQVHVQVQIPQPC
ncbi:hypothetical protein P170DRAFT_473538 [Aspergillus steynii IBT 23096]|uniref:Uncharacterized protein n=1 Tax=Aspergillus steynii IBT 23096 TaxID=1392250 RepID=A0A2I2GAQ3_9EURO|nr:uncharacterized protein P170DRAFT_473538 [Aspergillus steynii IBT 23096]PLB49964.1 hypothetical protein P170DRAFT_473538 [Aspergillus steynii IBT 23096]